MQTIGFIGLGHMGQPMVRNLLAAGYRVKVFDVIQESMTALAHDGAILASRLFDVATDVDVVFTMVQTSQQAHDVCLSEHGIFQTLQSGKLYIDCSSIDITVSRQLHDAARAKGIAMLDAPVSGGVGGATLATLTIMVGGDETIFNQAKPLLQTLGKKIIYAGPKGNGQAAKICNNLILGISMIAVSEGFNLAEKLGLNAKTFFEITSNASGQCWSMTSNCPVPHVIENVPANYDYQPGFMAKMMLKDLMLAMNAAESVNAEISLGKKATELYQQFIQEGKGELDFSAIIQMLE